MPEGQGANATTQGQRGTESAGRDGGVGWLAPAATGPVRATVTLPGSKSVTNRALVLAALADAPSLIRRPLHARDTLLMAAALRALGVGIAELPSATGTSTTGTNATGTEGAHIWRVTPFLSAGAPAAVADTPRDASRLGSGPAAPTAIDVGNAGTVLRFVPPAATLARRDTAFDGDPRARKRPVGPLITALRELGAVIDDGGRGGLPFLVHGRGALPGGAVTLDASSSSQLISALLLAGARFDKGVEVRHHGPAVPSIPHITMTSGMLRDAGVQVESVGRTAWRVRPGPLRVATVEVEPDLSNAAPFLAAALVCGGSVTIAGWPARTAQPGDSLRELLTEMGATFDRTAAGLTVHGSGPIHGLTADLRDVSELVPVLTALAALASSPSRFTGIAHMRTHECDRLAALAREINALGGDVSELPDGLAVRPRPLLADASVRCGGPGEHGPGTHSSAVFTTYDDHRMVMAAAVLGLAVPGLRVAGAATVAKTMPSFTRLWAGMLERTP